ncbi:patatin [Mesorhizobium waimense]|uniref:Patatin n=1 Tax=Mesorhizobium waimense TaxID=1300307 RepID=A0A3A5K2N6_9HYPH|nr:patatin-like phospholipase family protein [Mesorhizobium waimense]RJT29645.1 patatin [Mesorhizobium waimense]
MRWRVGWLALAGTLLAGCVGNDVEPINTHVTQVGPGSPAYIPDAPGDGSTVVALSFSGGGTRAAAFSYGVLQALDGVVVGSGPRAHTLIDDVRVVGGVSGGAVTAAYLGYKGHGYRDLRERFLLQNAESSLHTAKLAPANLARLWKGGINDRSTLAAWLNSNLFDGATYSAFKRPGAPLVWIHASDIYNGTAFGFTYDRFAAICSDLDRLRIADAVAASAAFPVVFAPLVVSTTTPKTKCNYTQPDWIRRGLQDPEAPLRVKAAALALDSYQNNDRVSYIKLLDGGLTDNIAVVGFAESIDTADSAHSPLSPAAAVRMRTLIMIVADAGRRIEPDWVTVKQGPGLVDMIDATAGTSIASSVRDEFDALKLEFRLWREKLVKYRCSLPPATVARYRGGHSGWNCRDVRMTVELVSFADLPPAEGTALNAIPTRLKLTPEQVDRTIDAGREAVRANTRLQQAFGRAQGRPGIVMAVLP